MHLNTFYSLLFILTFSSVRSCQTYFSFDYSSCIFQVDYNPNATSCQNFQFVRCGWIVCSQYYYSVDGTKRCGAYQTRISYGWEICTGICCDADVEYDQTYAAIRQCQEHSDSAFKIALVIVFAIFGSIICIVLSFVCYCTTCCLNIRDRWGIFRSNGVQEEDSSAYNLGQAQINNKQNKQNAIECQWISSKIEQTQLNNICSVCLDDKPSLQLQCGHVFHRKCIIECLRKKQECILCRTNSFNQVKVYCQNCFSAHYQTTLLEHIALLQNSRQVCDGCQEAGF